MAAGNDTTVLFWFRRDLRLDDNAGLLEALQSGARVVPVFVFDKTILQHLPHEDRRVEFLVHAVGDLKARLRHAGGDLVVRHDRAEHAIPTLARELGASAVYANEDYEPAAHERDHQVAEALEHHGTPLRLFKDTAIFSNGEVLTKQGKPYTVFTPYKKAWRARLKPEDHAERPSTHHLDKLAQIDGGPMPTLASLGFAPSNLADMNIVPTRDGALALLDRFDRDVMADYTRSRNVPAEPGSSFLSVYNRFGLVSVRELARRAMQAISPSAKGGKPPAAAGGAETWLGELVWRDFYFQFLYHHPRAAGHPFREEYEHLRWDNDETMYKAWCQGQTGYPMVDAAMVQLNTTGYMHNRLRMLTASFLTKDLLVDYRWGERWFARQLLDYDLSANNGGWQWAASTGCDPQPYFRIFSPARQSETFDRDAAFIKKQLPALRDVPAQYLHEPWLHEAELAKHGIELGKHYPRPIVDHAVQRPRALAAYKAARRKT